MHHDVIYNFILMLHDLKDFANSSIKRIWIVMNGFNKFYSMHLLISNHEDEIDLT